jgi:hypothetical protein
LNLLFLSFTRFLRKLKTNDMNIQSFLLGAMIMVLGHTAALAQRVQRYDLKQLLSENKLEAFNEIAALSDGKKQGISARGVVWLKDVTFSEGTIELDLRGKDVFQQSFLGVAFYGIDTAAYDVVYFRPFNFQSKDSVRRIHAVQYISEPDYPWDRLRSERNGIYEKAVKPVPDPNDWFHARIEVGKEMITVYVNNASEPCLKVAKLTKRSTGKVGIWASRLAGTGLKGEFANLTIRH